MLSELIIKRNWYMLTVLTVIMWLSYYLALIGLHYAIYGGKPANAFANIASTAIVITILYNARETVIKKRKIMAQIYDLNNKLGPLCLLPQLMKEREHLNDTEFLVLFDNAADTGLKSIDDSKQIICKIHDEIEIL